MAIVSILGVVTKFIQGFINDKYGFEATLIFSAILPIVSVVMLVAGYHSIGMMVLFAVLAGIGGVGSSIPYLLVASIYGKENNSKGSSIVNNFIVGGQVVAAIGLFSPLGNDYYSM
jgi:MFS family permease